MDNTANGAWEPEWDDILETIARTSEPSTSWEIIRKAIKHRIDERANSLPLQLDVEQHRRPNYVAPDSPSTAQSECDTLHQSIFSLLSSFSECPFTIQRLAELSIHPQKYYTTRPKALRAIQRTLQVSSPLNNYILRTFDDDLESAPSATLNGIVGSTQRSAKRRRTSATPSPSLPPLLSPIPWLVNAKVDELDNPTDLDLNNGHTDTRRPATNGSHSPILSPTNTHPPVSVFSSSPASDHQDDAIPSSPPLPVVPSPTHGRVDEMDPLELQEGEAVSGMDDHPHSLTHSQELEGHEGTGKKEAETQEKKDESRPSDTQMEN